MAGYMEEQGERQATRVASQLGSRIVDLGVQTGGVGASADEEINTLGFRR